jgi:hypothetical protein
LRQRIFLPLNMKTAIYGDPDERGRATGHYRSFVDGNLRTLPLPIWPAIPASPAGGCWMSVLDLAKFLGAHLSGGGPILSPETTAEMQTIHARQGESASGQGLGWRVTRSNGRMLICHGGDGGGFTAFVGGYPDEGAGVVLLINTGGQQVARSVIANTALATLIDAQPARTFAAISPPEGAYRSTFWEVVIEAREGVIGTKEGLVVADEGSESRIAERGGQPEGDGGMFHGFELSFEDNTICGGVYPFTFVLEGDITEEPPLDETATLVGRWQGTLRTTIGPLATTIEVPNFGEATVTTPLGTSKLANVRAENGRFEGDFATSIPAVGELHNFLRLAVRGGRLTGKTYARNANFGEIAMYTELERTNDN